MCKILCNIIDIIITMSKYIIYIYQNVNTHFNIILYQIIQLICILCIHEYNNKISVMIIIIIIIIYHFYITHIQDDD